MQKIIFCQHEFSSRFLSETNGFGALPLTDLCREATRMERSPENLEQNNLENMRTTCFPNFSLLSMILSFNHPKLIIFLGPHPNTGVLGIAFVLRLFVFSMISGKIPYCIPVHHYLSFTISPFNPKYCWDI